MDPKIFYVTPDGEFGYFWRFAVSHLPRGYKQISRSDYERRKVTG